MGEAWKRSYQRLGSATGFRGDNYTANLNDYYGRRAREVGTRCAFIVECGFLTNPAEGAELRSRKGRARAAKALAEAVEEVVGGARPRLTKGTSIASAPRARRRQAHQWADSRSCAPVFHKIIDAGWKHARTMGIDPAVFVAQAPKETGFGRLAGYR